MTPKQQLILGAGAVGALFILRNKNVSASSLLKKAAPAKKAGGVGTTGGAYGVTKPQTTNLATKNGTAIAPGAPAVNTFGQAVTGFGTIAKSIASFFHPTAKPLPKAAPTASAGQPKPKPSIGASSGGGAPSVGGAPRASLPGLGTVPYDPWSDENNYDENGQYVGEGAWSDTGEYVGGGLDPYGTPSADEPAIELTPVADYTDWMEQNGYVTPGIIPDSPDAGWGGDEPVSYDASGVDNTYGDFPDTGSTVNDEIVADDSGAYDNTYGDFL